MRVALVGSDYEENLGIGMIAAGLVEAKHHVHVVPFNEDRELDAVVDRVLARRPALVGLAVQFQYRAWEFLLLSRKLRAAGFEGHITCGGQWPTLASAEILANEPAVDSVVLHEGEGTIVELATALAGRGKPESVPGLALRGPGNQPYRTAPRRLCDDLDTLPFAYRYRPVTRQLGIPFIPMSGSRGCWGACAYCTITSYYRDACSYGGARKLRLRSPDNIAAEMAALWHGEGGPCVFCFHDDTFLLPRPDDTLERVRALRSALDRFGVGNVGLIGKARPECVTPALARELRRLGVIRMFVGVDNVSQCGQDHLNRRTRTEEIERALAALDDAGIYVCYNLLVFEPDAQLAHVRENVEFMRAHAHIPANFCRAEPYHGTPIWRQMAQRDMLSGSFLGWDYRLRDDRTELLFRIATTAFRDRNFDGYGLVNRYMGFGYLVQLLRCFYDCSSPCGRLLLDRCGALVCDITNDTADLLSEALHLAESCDLADHGRIERETALLGLRVAAHDRVLHARLDELIADVEEYAAEQPLQRNRTRFPKQLREVLQGLTIAGVVAATVSSCGGATEGSGTPTADAGAAGEGGMGGTGGLTPDGGSGGGELGGHVGSGGEGAPGGTIGVGGQEGVGGWPGYGGVNEGVGGWIGYGGWYGDSGGVYPGYGGLEGVGGTPYPNTGGWVGDGGGGGAGGVAASSGGGEGGVFDGGDAGVLGQGGGGGRPDSDGGSSGLAGDGGEHAEDAGGAGAGGDLPSGGMAGLSGGDSASGGGGGVTGGAGSGATGMSGSSSGQGGLAGLRPRESAERRAASEHWVDTSPRYVTRTRDLPLWKLPAVRLQSRADGHAVRVRLCGEEQNMSLRWESNGEVEGEGREVTWRPASRDDQLRVAVRTPGGVAVTSLRARHVQGS